MVRIQNILRQFGEWGIKLKDKLLQKTLFRFLFRMILWTILVPTLFIIIGIILSSLDFEWVYNISPNFYYTARHLFNKIFSQSTVFFAFLIWLIGAIILLYRLLKKVFSYLDAISEASNQMLDDNVEYVDLPVELDDIQRRMNHLKRESMKNERLARENEQKKNDLIVYLAHDLKTPLTSMIGYLSLLDEIKDMPKEQREKYIEVALQKSYRLEDLINELFDIARFNTEKIILEKEEINLNLMLEQIIEDFYPILKENGKEIHLEITEKIILDGDSDKLARVFGNLIKNAVYYSTDSNIKISVEKKESIVSIIVRNKAKKISDEKLKRLFEKFYRVDTSRISKTGGSGLGLAIAKEIIELHGGTINAVSEEEMKFLLELPVKEK